MKKFVRYLAPCLTLFVCPRLAKSQSVSTFIIKGKLVDSADGHPLQLATVYVKNPVDSSLLGYALTNEKGIFEVKDIPKNKPAIFLAFYFGYGTFKKIIKESKDTLNLETIPLSVLSKKLNEVTITGDAPPIAIKGDTIEFNASSFKTRPNSVLADLLKKLPGVDVDQDGNITANGEKVDKIEVDGKAFFGNDPKIALQNLPAGIVDKVQITDTKTTEQQLSDEPPTGDTKTINITLKRGEDHGFFGRAYAGYGTGGHYDASALWNHFEGKRRISILGAANNINEVGFTMNEIINLQGGNNNVHSLSVNSNGAFGVNRLNFGSNQDGLKKTTTAGINYNDDYGKHFSVNTSYFYGGLTLDNDTKTERQNILPDSVFYYKSDNSTHNDNINNRVTASFDYKDSLWDIDYQPYIGISHQTGISQSSATSTGAKGALVNQSNSLYTNDDQTNSFQNEFDLHRSFKKDDQSLGLYFNLNNTKTIGNDFNKYTNLFYDGSTANDIANQYINNQSTNNSFYGSIRYSQPFSKSVDLRVGYEINEQYGLTDKKTYDFNNASGKYSVIDSAYSNRFQSNIITNTPEIGLQLNIDSSKWTFEPSVQFNIIHLHDYSYNYDIAFDQNQFFISPRIFIRRKFAGNHYLRLDYYAIVSQPDISQLLPIADNTNPLYITKGNPDLKPAIYKYSELNYYAFNVKTGNSIWATLGYRSIKNNIVDYTTYNDQLSQTTTYVNVNGNNDLNLYLSLNKTKKEANHHWQIRLNNNEDISNSHAFVNGVPYASHSYNAEVHTEVTYGYKELLEITPSYRLQYQYSKYNITALNDQQNTMYTAGFSGTLYWPGRITWESDWNYTRNSNVAPGFSKGFLLWNASISLDVFKNRQGTFKFSVFDLLNQNTSVQRNITDTYIEDTQTTILQRYFMLKFIYNLKKFGEKKKKDNEPFFFF